MGTDYKLRIYDTSYALQYEIVNFHHLSYVKEVNKPGVLNFGVSGAHDLVASIGDKWPVEAWRRNLEQEIDWYADFFGLFREPDRVGVAPGAFLATCPGQLSLLSWPVVAWSTGTDDRTRFVATAAETIMKTLVSYNAGSEATSGNGRKRTWSAPHSWTIDTESDGAGGNTINWYCAWANLLETLQELSTIAGGDFDMVKTGTTTWEFRWYAGQLGTDRTATVLLSTELGNMGNPQWRANRLGERTVAIVGGQDEGDSREVEIRTGTNYSADNDIEMFVDARNSDTSGGLQDKGDQALDEVEATEEFRFDALQTQSTMYGKHYFLGDLVTARSPYTGSDDTKKLQKVSVTVSGAGEESIGVELIDA